MSSNLRKKGSRGIAAIAGLALVLGLTPVVHADDVTQDDIDKAKAEESATSTSIANLEAQLAQLSADLEDAQISAQVANEDYLAAAADLDTATDEAETAQTNADNAAAETAAARVELGAVVSQTYAEGGNPLDALAPYLTTDSLGDMAEVEVALTRAGENTDAKVQNVEALQAVADTMQSLADEKVVAKQDAADTAATAKTNAETAAADAQEAVSNAETERASLISELAAQRNTTVELETQYQAQLEAERKAREEAEAKAAAEAAAAAAAAEQAQQQAQQAEEPSSPPADSGGEAADPGSGESSGSGEGSGAGSAEPESQPAPAPEPEPDPDPGYSGGGGASAAVSAAYSYLGAPYAWGGESYGGVDCSGLTMLAYRSAGIYLTHSSRAQYEQGTKVPLSSAQEGDLIFWSQDGSPSGIYHVALYLGGGQIIEAPTFGMTVRVTSMSYGDIMPYAVRP